MMMTKGQIRQEMLKERRRIPPLAIEQRSGIIVKKLVQTQEYRDADWIWTYVSLPKEVQTFSLIEEAWKDGKHVAVPKVKRGDRLVFLELTTFDQLKEGTFHILEPEYGREVEDPSALLVLPGLAFDLQKNRIGYGKGYYDRFLTAHPGHPTAALSFDFALRTQIPSEEGDVRPDLLITDRRIIR